MAFVAEDEPFVLNKYTQEGEYQWSGQFTTKGDAYGFMSEIKNNRILIILYYTDSLFYRHDTPWMIANPGKHLALITMTQMCIRDRFWMVYISAVAMQMEVAIQQVQEFI